jgi:DNA-binding beta-propeller fold protein YncE
LRSPLVYTLGNQVFVPDETNQTLYVIDGKSNFVTPVSPSLSWPWAAELGLSNLAYASTGGTSVNVADAANDMSIVATIPTEGMTGEISANAAADLVYVSTVSDLTVAITVIDTKTNTSANSIPVGNDIHFWGMSLDPILNTLYVATSPGNSRNSSVSVFDAISGTLLGTTEPLAQIFGVLALPGTGKTVVAGGKRAGGQLPNTLIFVDGTSLEVTRKLRVGSEPIGMAYNSATKILYVGNFASNTLSVIGKL